MGVKGTILYGTTPRQHGDKEICVCDRPKAKGAKMCGKCRGKFNTKMGMVFGRPEFKAALTKRKKGRKGKKK